MANLRPILFMGLLVLSYMMWVEWQKDYGPQPRCTTDSNRIREHRPYRSIARLPDIPMSRPATSGDLPPAERC